MLGRCGTAVLVFSGILSAADPNVLTTALGNPENLQQLNQKALQSAITAGVSGKQGIERLPLRLYPAPKVEARGSRACAVPLLKAPVPKSLASDMPVIRAPKTADRIAKPAPVPECRG